MTYGAFVIRNKKTKNTHMAIQADDSARNQGADISGSRNCVCVLFEGVVVGYKEHESDTDGQNVAISLEISVMLFQTQCC